MPKNSKHQLSVPFVISDRMKKEDVLDCLKRCDADYVFLSYSRLSANRKKNEESFSVLSEYIPYFKSFGYKVGIWVWSFWLDDVSENGIQNELMVRSNGSKRLDEEPCGNSGSFCPTYENARGIVLDALKVIASYNPDIILFDDDFDYTIHNGSFGCFCGNHIKLISERLGRAFDRESLKTELFEGKTNETREAWHSLLGETLEDYARSVRLAVDSVNPDIRIGLCSVMSMWGIDGTNAEKIAKILAGKNKPFIRLIGAPYWAVNKAFGYRLQNVIEFERLQYSQLKDKDGIDVLYEGDVYPRPRHTTPASYLECFDTALKSANVGSGIHKYMFDYTSNGRYEPGYLDRHLRNAENYRAIERIFADKVPVGVRVYENSDYVRKADLTGIDNPEGFIVNAYFSHASKLLADNSVPTTYQDSNGVGIAFGENARQLPDSAFDGGLILDIRAAKILMEQGIDVGIERIGAEKHDSLLYFPEEDDCTGTAYRKKSAYEIIPKPTAQTVVYSLCGEKRQADAIHYRNANGTRFLVYSFDAAFTDERRYRSYYTQNQLFMSIEWLSGSECPVVCKGNPDCYVLCSESEGETAVGLWNLFADTVFKPTLTLAHEYKAAEFINCSGTLNGNELILSDIAPYAFAVINLTK